MPHHFMGRCRVLFQNLSGRAFYNRYPAGSFVGCGIWPVGLLFLRLDTATMVA